MSQFVWTDELAMEYARGVAESFKRSVVWSGNFDAEKNLLDSFKVAKQPKPEWEILTYSHFQEGIHIPSPYCTTNGHCKIHSVKRLSDGEVFTVGDEVMYEGEERWPNYKIDRFEVVYISMLAYKGTSGVNINLLANRTPPIFPVLLTSAQIEKLHKILKNTQ